MLKEIGKYLNREVKSQKFEEGLELYKHAGEGIDKAYDKKMKFFKSIKDEKNKVASMGLLINSLNGVARKLKQKTDSKKKNPAKQAIQFQENQASDKAE